MPKKLIIDRLIFIVLNSVYYVFQKQIEYIIIFRRQKNIYPKNHINDDENSMVQLSYNLLRIIINRNYTEKVNHRWFIIGVIMLSISCVTHAVQTEITLNEPFGIAVKPDGSFYVSEMGAKRISKFDSTGVRIGEITNIKGYGLLQRPFDVYVATSGNLYIVDADADRVLVLDSNEQLILTLGTGKPSATSGSFHNPHFVTADESRNRIYVADTHNHRVQVFSTNGTYLQTLGVRGENEPDSYYYAVGIDCDEDGRLYCMSWYGGIINIYDAKGRFLHAIGKHGNGPGEFNEAYGLTCHQGTIWVADTYNNRLHQVASNASPLKIIGGREGSDIHHFSHPSDVDLDAAGNIYVVDWKNNRVIKLNPKGHFLAKWGSCSADMGYDPPATHIRSVCREPVTIGTYSGISKAAVDEAVDAGVDWIYVSIGNQSGEWQIKEQVDYAHQQGVKVSVSIAIYPLGANSDKWKHRPEFYMWKKGDTEPNRDALSYFFPEVRRWKAKHIAEQLRRNNLDGILLDYIRYPNNLCGYEPSMRKKFQQETGRDVQAIAPDDWDWITFRARYITLFIAELKYELAQEDAPIEISAFVGPDWEQDLQSSMRDWRTWARMGLVDKLCLGIYSRDFKAFYDGIIQTRRTCPENTKVSIFIACWGGNLNTPLLLTKGAAVSFAAGADEVTIYRGDAITRLNMWGTIGTISAEYKSTNK